MMRSSARAVLFWFARLLNALPKVKGRNRLFTLTLRLAERLGPPIVVEIEGLTLELDMRDGLCRGLWVDRSFAQGRTLSELCRDGDVVLDVGANIGHLTLLAAREVGTSGRVVAIEPGQRTFSLLERNAKRNFPDRITVMRAACGEEDGTTTLFVSDYSGEFSSLRPDGVIGGSHQETVPVRSLHSLCSELELVPDVVKIDVEGAEWSVLKGLFEDDAPRPGALLVEAYAPNTAAFGYRPSEMCAWLAARRVRARPQPRHRALPVFGRARRRRPPARRRRPPARRLGRYYRREPGFGRADSVGSAAGRAPGPPKPRRKRPAAPRAARFDS